MASPGKDHRGRRSAGAGRARTGRGAGVSSGVSATAGRGGGARRPPAAGRDRRRRPPAPGELERAAEVLARLEREMPEARIALRFGGDVELLVSVVLSAQCTDARVNEATPALFAAYPDAAAYAAASPEQLWPYIQRLGLYRNKAKAIVAAMQAIAREHGGRVPRERAALEALPGVGRKTAGVVLLHLGAAAAFPVDTHVGRVSRRLGFTRELDPGRVEADLERLWPPERWGQVHQLFVWHGRRTCVARRPACSRCAVDDLCPKRGVKDRG